MNAVSDTAPMRAYIPAPRTARDDPPAPDSWAGGREVMVPGLGVGRIVRERNPRVIEIPLPVPSAAVFVLGEGDDARAVVLADPAVPPRELTATMRAASVLTEDAPSDDPAVSRRSDVWTWRALGAAGLAALGLLFAYSDLSPTVIELVGR